MAYLKIVEGGNEGKTIALGAADVTIGRSQSNTLPLDDGAISGRHCVIKREGERYVLRDLQSTNGTSVNEENVDEAVLRRRDVISVGGVSLLFDGEDLPEEDEAVPETAVGPTGTVRMERPIRTSAEERALPSPAEFNLRDGHKTAWAALAVVALAAVLALLAYRVFSGLFAN